MRRIYTLSLTAALVALASTGWAQEAAKVAKGKAEPSKAGTWTIDPGHSSASFEVRHMMVSTVQGRFSDVKGTIVLDEKNLAKSSIEAEIGVESVSTGNDKRDQHLKAKDFFDAKQFPKMTFKSSKVTKADGGEFNVEGELTIKGVTKPVTLKVTELTKPVKNPMAKGVMVRGARATTEIDRTAFGLTWNKTMDKGGVVVGEKVKVTLDVELQQAQGAAAAAPKGAAAATPKK